MAESFDPGNSDRDIDKALIALKKGAQLLKYGRKGRPKFYPFRLSNDETQLIWLSSGNEKVLSLASVSRIIPGQRTAVFRRYLCRDKEYLSFSLIYKNGERSLDLICKDKAETEVWFAGLKVLIASGRYGRSKIDGWQEEGIFEDNRDLASNSFSDSSISATLDGSSPDGSVITNNLSNRNSSEKSVPLDRSDPTNMHVKGGASSDVLRVSVSSAPSTSSHGSLQDDYDSLGDVYIWGEIICDISSRAGEKYDIPFSGRADALLPRPLESNTVLDVQHVACGVSHAAMVTKHGEVFTWGEESGGRLGHGLGSDVVQPRLVDSLATGNVDFVACGEFHTCAITIAGDLYTWGDGIHNAGLLGHGNDISHCVPRRVSGPLEGLHVSFVACGTWHTALITSAGQLFTFGDGTFGVLGHGNRESCAYPKEVESLKGLNTFTVACGVWHTAAVVEVMVTQSSASISSGKLFSWGDGDKFRLGHGDKEPRLKPTCVSSLIDYNFHNVACGHSITVGLTTSGRIFTMGSTVYGQLGNPNSDGKAPCSVEDKLAGEFVREVSCGSYHVAVLTTKNEVYTWGKGANGRLGHGDIEDRKTPTLVETLKDRPVKQIACGSNFTAAICQHKWVSGADQSQCSSCRQPFGFTRKRHNCYNCGLVHCHSCSSRKALRAALSPNPAKFYRVCDSCYLKLNKGLESSATNYRKTNAFHLPGESKERFEKTEVKLATNSVPAKLDLMMILDSRATKIGKKPEPFSLLRAPFSSAVDSDRAFLKGGYKSKTHSVSNSRAASPFSRRPSPPRSATPIPTTSGLSVSKPTSDGLKETNEVLNHEIRNLQAEVESLKRQCELQELELQKSAAKAREAVKFAAEESAKSKAAKEVMKSLTAQLKDVAEKLPAVVYDSADSRPVYIPNGTEAHTDDMRNTTLNRDALSRNDLSNDMCTPSPKTTHTIPNGMSSQVWTPKEIGKNAHFQSQRAVNLNINMIHQNSYSGMHSSGQTGIISSAEPGTFQNHEKIPKPRALQSIDHQAETEWLEQYEPGVYITLMALPDGARDLKRVRFSRRRFGEHQAETWWSENREKVFQKYNVRASDKSPMAQAA